MLDYTPEHIHAPALAVEVGHTTVRALLYVPGMPREDSYSWQLPAPDAILAKRVRASTTLRKAIHLHGTGMGPAALQALLEHVSSGAAASMHPETAASLTDAQSALEIRGIAVTRSAHPESIVMEAADHDPALWRTLMDLCGLPQPEITLVAAFEHGRLLDREKTPDALPPLFLKLMQNRVDGLALDSLMSREEGAGVLRLSAIRRMTGFPVLDSSFAFILGLMALPALAGRALRQGVTLLHLDSQRLLAALVFQGRLLGLLHLPMRELCRESGAFSPERLLGLLEDFRLGWLPVEKTGELGGAVWRPAHLPPEAEGFAPMFASGPHAHLLDGRVRVLDAREANEMNICRGLLYGYDTMLS